MRSLSLAEAGELGHLGQNGCRETISENLKKSSMDSRRSEAGQRGSVHTAGAEGASSLEQTS